MQWWERLKYEFNKGNSPVRKLIFINTGVFVLTLVLGFVAHLYKSNLNDLLRYLELPSWGGELLKRPWTLITYMFLHAGFWHLLFNMLFLYFIGRILEDFQSTQRFYTIYFGGGLAGALFYLLAYNLFPVFTSIPEPVYMLGASGAVTAIVIATATLVPQYEVYLYGIFRVKLVWLAIVIVLMDIALFPSGNEGGRLAHLGGAAFGFLYIRYLKGGLFDSRLAMSKLRNLFRPKYQVIDEKELLKRRPNKPGRAASERVGRSKPEQDEIDSILDKINQSGYSSLTSEEKEILFKASE
ncbi:MAG: rhomboid family intramembrane serine protease [Flavobacteriales bacterium]|nr:rhomboid family intramembrane serine protease [Flavobacteriales bacterium]